jgi:hypothetical protein
MRNRPSKRSGPFLVPARIVLLVSGLLAIGLAVGNLYYQFQGHQVDVVYAGIALAVAVVWLAGVIAAYLGWRLGIFVSGAIGFVQFCVLASSEFVVGPNDIDVLWKAVGLPVAPVEMGLIAASIIVVISAVVAWGSPTGRAPELESLPVLIVAVAAAVLVILQATDTLQRDQFGASNPEDGTLTAAIFAAGWLLGALWMASAQRLGALLVALTTFAVWFSFVTTHLLNGGTPITAIAKRSGAPWAVIDASAAILAAASFVFSVVVLVLLTVRQMRAPRSDEAPVRRRA